MSRRAVATALFCALMAGPLVAQPWREVAQGDGYVSKRGTIRLAGSPQAPEKVLSVARAFAGIPYVWAGHDPVAGFDCSGYAFEVLRLNGYEVPRMADQQFEATRRVAYGDLEPGDLVFFETYMKGPSHVGFYLGQGDFIHASSAANGVVVSQMESGYYRERFLGGGRPDGWREQPLRVARLAEPVVALPDPAVEKAISAGKAQNVEVPLSTSPFAKRRAPQPVRVAVHDELASEEEAALRGWSLMLGETVAMGRLQWSQIRNGLATALGV